MSFRQKYVTLLLAIIMLLILVTAPAQTVHKSTSFSSGTTVTGSSVILKTAVGQPLIGVSSSPGFQLYAGFIPTISTQKLPDLELSAVNVIPSTFTAGSQPTITFSLTNSGDSTAAGVVKVSVYLSTNALYEQGDLFLQTFDPVVTDLAEDAEYDFPVGQQPNKVAIPAGTADGGYYLILIADPLNSIPEHNETNNIASFFVQVQGDQSDKVPPLFGVLTAPDKLTDGASISINVTDNNSGVKSVKFLHRKILDGNVSFDVENTSLAGNVSSITLNEAWADEVGFEYKFVATDNALNSDTLKPGKFLYRSVPVNQSIPNLSFGGQPENYRIFSIPYELADNRIDEIFKDLGEYDKTKWRIVRYQGGRNVDKKDGLTKIERGQAFWYNAIDNTNIKIGAGTTVNKDQAPDFSLSLDKGYNQIGDPFTFDISWADVLAVNSSHASKLSQQILVYNSANVSLDPSDKLKAWSGGFVLADEAMTLSIPVSLKNGGGRMMPTQILNGNPDLDQWLTTIHIQQGDVLNSLGGIGMHPDAKQSKDIYDIVTPPKFIQYIGMSTEHDDFFEPKFSRDIVPTSPGYNWNFTLESNINTSQAEISWNNSELHSAKAQLLLYDVDQRLFVDMKQSDRYTFNPQRSRNFRFFFGSDASQIKPDIQEIGQVWPNPITDVANIPYVVKERSQVQIDVYDMMGRHVNRVVDSQQDAGYYLATWNRNSFDGSRVSPGMYLYRMNGSINVGRIIVN